VKTFRTSLGFLTGQELRKTIDVVTLIHDDGAVQSYVEVSWEYKARRGWRKLGKRTFGNANAALSFYDGIN
jgi:hypothetical protein